MWDVDGTIAETERDGHRVAFNLAFAALGLPWCWNEPHYGRLLHIAGGRERLLHDMAWRETGPTRSEEREALAHALHHRKNEIYADLVRAGRIALRPGVLELMLDCRAAQVPMAIATTTSRTNVAALLHATLGEGWRDWFDSVVCGEDVAHKKPDPEVYLRACSQLRVAAGHSVAIEDSPSGAAAARAAGLQVIVTRSFYFADDRITPVTAIGPGLEDASGWQPAVQGTATTRRRVGLADVERWCYRSSVNSN